MYIIVYDHKINQFSKCQTESTQEWKTVEELQQKICMLETSLSISQPLDIAILEGSNKLTCMYTGMPTYDSFIAFIEYLEPKANQMVSCNSSRAKELSSQEKQSGTRYIFIMSIPNQLFSVLI